MAPRTSATFAKRQKERARQEKQQAKQERKLQRRLEKRDGAPGPTGEGESNAADASGIEAISDTTTAAGETAPTERELQ